MKTTFVLVVFALKFYGTYYSDCSSRTCFGVNNEYAWDTNGPFNEGNFWPLACSSSGLEPSNFKAEECGIDEYEELEPGDSGTFWYSSTEQCVSEGKPEDGESLDLVIVAILCKCKACDSNQNFQLKLESPRV